MKTIKKANIHFLNREQSQIIRTLYCKGKGSIIATGDTKDRLVNAGLISEDGDSLTLFTISTLLNNPIMREKLGCQSESERQRLRDHNDRLWAE